MRGRFGPEAVGTGRPLRAEADIAATYLPPLVPR